MRTLSIVIFISLVPAYSSACRERKPLTDEIKNRATSVFVGEAISYAPRPKNNSKSDKWKPAVIRFKVERTISGPEIKQIDVYWINGTFGESQSLQEFRRTFGKKSRVGITNTNRSPEAEVFRDKPWVVQDPCTPPFMLPEN